MENNSDKAENTSNHIEPVTVFVTYCWDNEEHNEKVHAFTNFLRDNGFHAEMDKMLSQNETAKDFKVMMHKGMTDYKKVIVILSEGYKEKAEKFKGGVGNEYSLILKDIEDNPNKYILVSFDGRDNNVVPLFFKSREIIDFSKEDEEEKQKLFSKLLDKKRYQFNDVAQNLPVLESKNVPSLFSVNEEKKDIEILDLNLKQDNASYLYQLLKYIELNLTLSFKNTSAATLNEYNIEIFYPKEVVSYDVDGRIEGEYKVVTLEESSRIFPQQIKSHTLNKIILRDYTIQNLIDKSIIVKIYSEKSVVEKIFPLNEFLINSFNGLPTKLSTKLFLDKSY